MLLDLIMGILGILYFTLAILTFVVALVLAGVCIFFGPALVAAAVFGAAKAFVTVVEKTAKKAPNEGRPKEPNGA